MKDFNGRYRGLERTTDVLAFPMYATHEEIPADRDFVLGDIVINLKAAHRQSEAYRLTLYQEVRRLLIHGFLHLLGYDHEISPSEERRMRRKERDLKRALATLD